jgi:predicted transcriptional regulator
LQKSVEVVKEGLSKEEQIANTESTKNIFKAINNNYNTLRDFYTEIFKDKVNSMIKVFNDKNTERYLSINFFGNI